MATQTAADVEAIYAWGGHGVFARAWRATKRFVRTQPLGTFGIVVIVLIVFGAVFANYLHTSDPTAFGNDILAKPGTAHFFGTNREGRDVWSRVLYGARPALEIGLGTVLVSVVLGSVFALLAGFLGGIVDAIISRFVDIFISLPAILWALVLSTSADSIPGLGTGGVRTLIVAISIGLVPAITRIMRGNVIQEKSRQYVEAARVIGASELRIMFRHILPNLLPLIIIIGSATLPAAILAESGLSFLGLGLPQGDASWGADLGGKARSLFRTYWWLPIFPGLALSLTVLAFNLLGDSLRDTLDPRLRGRG